MVAMKLKSEDLAVFVGALLNTGLRFEIKNSFVRLYGIDIPYKTQWAYYKGRCDIEALLLSIERRRRRQGYHPVLEWSEGRIFFLQDLLNRGREEYKSLPKGERLLYLGLKAHSRRLWKRYGALYHEPF